MKMNSSQEGRKETGNCCLLCKETVTQGKGVSVGANLKLPLSGLDVISLLQCYNVAFSLPERISQQERPMVCKQCYKLVMKGDSAYNYVYSVASKMSRLWSANLSHSVSFSLNFPRIEDSSEKCSVPRSSNDFSDCVKSGGHQDAEKHVWKCIYCESEFENEYEMQLHEDNIHKVYACSQDIKQNIIYQNSQSSSAESVNVHHKELKDVVQVLNHSTDFTTAESKLANNTEDTKDLCDKQTDVKQRKQNLYTKSKQRKRKTHPNIPGSVSLLALKIKQELLLQEKEDDMLLSYLLSKDRVKGDKQLTRGSSSNINDCPKKSNHALIYSSNLAEMSCGLTTKRKMNPDENAAHCKSRKEECKTVLEKKIRKENFTMENSLLSNTISQGVKSRSSAHLMKNEEIKNKSHKFESVHQSQEQFYLLDEETRSVCGDDALTSVVNASRGEDLDVLEGGCAVVDIYDGPVNLLDTHDDFRCIIIN